eukprot:m.242101 g.242101  ORF g.242101 m.242101 type:complete len:95 (+) comp26325_c0_seq7:135-419(+)
MAGVGVGGAPSAQGLSVTAVLEVPGKPALDLGLALDVGSGHTLGSVIAGVVAVRAAVNDALTTVIEDNKEVKRAGAADADSASAPKKAKGADES